MSTQEATARDGHVILRIASVLTPQLIEQALADASDVAQRIDSPAPTTVEDVARLERLAGLAGKLQRATGESTEVRVGEGDDCDVTAAELTGWLDYEVRGLAGDLATGFGEGTDDRLDQLNGGIEEMLAVRELVALLDESIEHAHGLCAAAAATGGALTEAHRRHIETMAALEAWTLGDELNSDHADDLLERIDALNGCAELVRWARAGFAGAVSTHAQVVLRQVLVADCDSLTASASGDTPHVDDVASSLSSVKLVEDVLRHAERAAAVTA